jgi:hypothetical protein
VIYLVMGYTQSGKSTVGQFISEATGLKMANVSDYLKVAYASIAGITIDIIEGGLRAAPEAWRNFLYIFGCGIEHFDGAALLTRMVDDGVRVICGVRTRHELEDFRKLCEARHVNATCLWVDRGTRGSTDGITSADVAEIMGGVALIKNDGSLQDLERKTREAIGKPLAPMQELPQ